MGKEHTLPAIYTFSKLFKTLFNMKKYILKLALLIASAVTGAAQNSSQILLNTQNAESGLRNLGTSDIIVRNGLADRHPLKVSLIAAETSTGWSYTIYIAVSELVSSAVPEGGLLLLRTKSGEVLEFSNFLTKYQSIDAVGRWIEGTASKIYDNMAAYRVTREQLELISTGVIKLRMQVGGGSFDTEYKKDRFGAAIATHLRVIDAEISRNPDIRGDF